MPAKALVNIACRDVYMDGMAELPQAALGVVVFAHGSGSSRFSPRNNYVARILHEADVGTLLLDLLTPDEAVHEAQRFDIALLTARLRCAVAWLQAETATAGLPVGLFGASTGAAAALRLAADPAARIAAVVSRGGRPDLAGAGMLAAVTAPTLLIVGGDDGVVVDLNRQAYDALGGAKELAIVPGAGHLFEEPGALEEVARLAAAWFASYLARAG